MLKVAVPALLLTLAACAAATQTASNDAAVPALQGRVVGEPMSCITTRDIEDTDAVTDRVLLFHMKNGRTYRSDLPQSCPRLDRPGTAFSHRTTISRLCSIDTIQVFDPAGGVGYGSCQLGEFVEYELPEGVDRSSL